MFGSRSIDEPPFSQVSDAATLETWLTAPGPVVLFLHDPHCPISRNAFGQVAVITGPVPAVNVSTDRALSKLIQERTGVRHESPQVIVLRNGRVVWHGSHFGITKSAVLDAVAEAERDDSPSA